MQFGIKRQAHQEMEDEMMAAEEFHMKILTQINRIKRFLVQHNSRTVGTLDDASGTVSNVLKMPKFDLPKYDGKYENWTSFHEQFMASVDSNASLPDLPSSTVKYELSNHPQQPH